MVRPVEPSGKQELQDRFVLSSRAAIRIGALWKKGLGVSEGFLEAADPDSPHERFLLAPALLEAGGDLDPDTLNRLLDTELDADRIPPEPLALDTDGDHPVLCLEEEKLAESAWDSGPSDARETEDDESADGPTQASTSGNGSMLSDAPSGPSSPLDREESETHFTEKKIGDLKMTVLTGVDPDQKIEALRQIAFAPVDEQIKGTMFLNALTDENADVREEAARGLEQMGLSEDLGETLQTFLSGNHEQTRYAGEKVKNMFDGCEAFEKAVVVALLESELDSADRVETYEVILEILHEGSDFIAENAGDHLKTLTRNVLEVLVSNFESVHRPVRTLYREIGTAVPERVHEILWEETQRVDRRELKAYLLILLAELPAEPERKRKMADEMVETIRTWSDTEIECRRLGNALVQLGPAGVRAVIDAFDRTGKQQRVYMLRLLDETLLDLEPDDELREELEAFLIDVTEIQDRNVREPLLDLHLLHHVSLSRETRRELARLLLESLKRFEGQRIERMTPIVLEKMDRHVIPVLMDYLRDGTYDIQREVALDVLGNVIPDVDPEEPDEEERGAIREQIDALDAHLADRMDEEDRDLRTKMIVTRSRVLAAPVSDPERARRHMDQLRDQVDEREDLYASLRALGWIAASPLIEEDRAMEVGLLLLNYLQQDLPDQISQDTEQETGRTLLVERESEAYTELIPTVIDGLTRICRRDALKESFRERIADELLDKWNDLVNFDLIWGPGTVTQLARHFGDLCTSPNVPIDLKERFLKALSRRVDNLTVAGILGDVLGSGLESRNIREQCQKITKAMLEMLEKPDYQDPEDRRMILDSLGSICARRNLAGDRTENKHLRKKVIDVLVDGLYDQIDGVLATLENLSQREQMPKKYREKIRKQIARYSDS